jgi:hypothetical protein
VICGGAGREPQQLNRLPPRAGVEEALIRRPRLVRTGAEDAREVEQYEDDDEDNDDPGNQQTAIAAPGLRIVVVFGKAWHLGSS